MFMSWCFAGVMALADYPIPENAYTWIAVVVLPINSAVNPVLYTLSEMVQKKVKILLILRMYSRTSMARTLMARLPRLFRTHS